MRERHALLRLGASSALLASLVLAILILATTPASATTLATDHLVPAPATDQAANGSSAGGLLGPLNPPDVNGVGVDHYDITADAGTFDFGNKILIFLSNAMFALERWTIGLASWLVEWVLDFRIADYLLAPVIVLCTTFQTQVIDRTGLGAFALFLAAAICGLWFLTGRHTRGISEFLTTLVIAAVASAFLTTPAVTIFGTEGVLDKTRDLSLEVATLTVSGGLRETGGATEISGAVRSMFVDTFIRKPHQLVNYGVLFDADPAAPHRCLDAYNEIVAKGPWGSDGTPRDLMRRCDSKLADFNATPTWDRLGAIMLSLVAGLFVSVLAVMVALSMLATQLWLVFETLHLLFALAIGVVPGPGRAQLWKALGGLAAALSGVVATVVFLALFVVLVRGLLTAAEDQSLFVRFLLLDVAIFCGIGTYRRVVRTSRRLAASLPRRWGARVGSDSPPQPSRLLNQGRREITTVTRPVRLVGRELRPSSIRKRARQVTHTVRDIRTKARGFGTKARAVAAVFGIRRRRRGQQAPPRNRRQPSTARPPSNTTPGRTNQTGGRPTAPTAPTNSPPRSGSDRPRHESPPADQPAPAVRRQVRYVANVRPPRPMPDRSRSLRMQRAMDRQRQRRNTRPAQTRPGRPPTTPEG